MERTLLCEIVTPERIVYAGEVRMVIVPTIDGEIGILPLHAPLVSALKPGEIRLRYPNDDVEWFAVSGGYIQVYNDKVIILADQAILASQIDVDHVRQSLEFTQRRLDELPEAGSLEFDSCQGDLKWCQLQIDVGRKQRS
ncbi:MAG: ATP synthase F1 subunit epsilon [Actinobacteria bacterium]|nr:ATP synthase F1 subunit epsilon [Actinomycetota bacterium]